MKKSGKKRSGKNFLSDSVFLRTWIIMVLLVFLIMALLLAAANRELQKNHRQRVQEINEQILEQNCRMTEEAVQMLQENMNQLFWGKEVVTYLIHPDSENQQQTIAVQQLLVDMSSSSNLIRRVWIYSPVSGTVISSGGEYSQLSVFSDRRIVEAHQVSEGCSVPDEMDGMTEILAEDSRVFLVQDMILARYTASIYLEINTDTLGGLLGLSEDGPRTAICSSTGQQILSDETDDITPAAEENSQGSESAGRNSQESESAGQDAQGPEAAVQNQDILMDGAAYHGEKWYGVYSSQLGWYFLRQVDADALRLQWRDSLLLFLPEILILLLIGIAGSYWITRRIYEPINQLVMLVLDREQKQRGKGAPQNEMDYLKLSFFRTLDQKDSLENSMNYFQRDIEEQVFRRLLQGEDRDSSGFSFMEETRRRKWEERAPWHLLLCLKEGELDAVSAMADAELFYRSICQLVEKWGGASAAVVIRMQSDLTAIVWMNPENPDAAEIRLEQYLQRAFRTGTYPVAVARGKDCPDPESLHYAWGEARQELYYRKYLKESFPENRREAIPAKEQAVQERKAYYRDHAIRILNMILDGRNGEAEQLLPAVVREMLGEAMEDAEKAVLWTDFRRIFRDKAAALGGKTGDDSSEPEPGRIGWETMSSEEQLQTLCRQLHRLTEEILAGSRKSTYQYVAAAKQYMETYFEDSSLGVTEVADYVHIHSTYLSKIFNEIEGESFSGWLNRLRVQRAMELLRTTDTTIGDIGFRCGFNTVQSFNRAFKKITGQTPSAYRKTCDSSTHNGTM